MDQVLPFQCRISATAFCAMLVQFGRHWYPTVQALAGDKAATPSGVGTPLP